MNHRVPMVFVMFVAFAAVPIGICLVVVWRQLRRERLRRDAALRGELPEGDHGFDVYPPTRPAASEKPGDLKR